MTLSRVRSVNREPIVYNDNEPTRVQTCDDDTSLFKSTMQCIFNFKRIMFSSRIKWTTGTYKRQWRRFSHGHIFIWFIGNVLQVNHEMNKHRVFVRKINKMHLWKLGAEGTQYKKGFLMGSMVENNVMYTSQNQYIMSIRCTVLYRHRVYPNITTSSTWTPIVHSVWMCKLRYFVWYPI